MKNFLKENRIPIIFILCLIFILPLTPIAVAIMGNEKLDISFTLSFYLTAVGIGLAFIIGGVLFAVILILLAKLVIKFNENSHDKKVKKVIIEKFNLTPNSFKEINVNFKDNEDTRNFFIESIKTVVNNTSCFNLNFHARIDDKTYDIPIKEEALNLASLIYILKELGCKFYLNLDDNQNFSWYIKTSDKEVLYKEELKNYDLILWSFTPKE